MVALCFATYFGNKVNSAGTTPNSYLYRGEQHDSDLGFYYLRARYYNPTSGRLLSVDQLAGEGQRRYEYANADPVDEMDPSGNEAIIEFALLTFYPRRLPVHFPGFPSWCGFAGSESLPGCSGSGGGGGTGADPGAPGGPPPPPDHWTVKVDYRSILRFKHGHNCNSINGIPGCRLPLGFVRHSYVEIDGPEGNHTWGVLGTDNTGKDQEMFEDHLDWDQDPFAGTAGIQSFVVSASDQEAHDFKQALENRVGPPYPDCPSCGIGIYHNGPLPPIDVVSSFSAFNSNTFTYNVIANFLGVTTTLGRAPGYHYSSRYAGYP